MARARITLKLGGKNRLIKFGLSAMKRYDDSVGKEGASLHLLMLNPMLALLGLTVFALTYDGNKNNMPSEGLEDLVSDWIDDLNEKDLNRLVEAMMLSIKKFGGAFNPTEKTPPE